MNIENLQLIKKNETSDNALRVFSRVGKVVSNETTLDTFKKFLIQKGHKITNVEFIDLFKDLETAGVGKLSYLGNLPYKFTWFYSLKSVSEQILNPNKLVNLELISFEKEKEENMNNDETQKTDQEGIKRGRGRPKGSSSKSPSTGARVVGRPRVVQDAEKETYLFFLLDSGESLHVKIHEAERFVKIFEAFKNKLN